MAQRDDNGGGEIVNKLLAILALTTVIVFAISCGISRSTEADRTKAYGFAQAQMTLANGQAQAQMTLASAESTKASAEASATRTAAMTPILATVAIAIFGMILLATPIIIVLILRYAPPPQMQASLPAPVRVIEQRTVLLLPADGMSRRELYQAIGGNAEVRQIGGAE